MTPIAPLCVPATPAPRMNGVGGAEGIGGSGNGAGAVGCARGGFAAASLLTPGRRTIHRWSNATRARTSADVGSPGAISARLAAASPRNGGVAPPPPNTVGAPWRGRSSDGVAVTGTRNAASSI